ncbi:hypothetical protein Bca4012_038822 [Brassica carinata]
MKKLKKHYDMLGYICDAQYGIPTRCPFGGEIKTDVSPNPKYRHDFDTLPGSRYFTCKNYEQSPSSPSSSRYYRRPPPSSPLQTSLSESFPSLDYPSSYLFSFRPPSHSIPSEFFSLSFVLTVDFGYGIEFG